jgi:hypothetical protein
MKLTKFDIGAEILSILTKGMYPDPRDAVREYIQNAVDAKAKDVDVKVRQSSVVIEDNGVGMDYQVLRNAIRLGISSKQPGKDVGFMGIGIYSAFHLCNKLTIYTRKADILPLRVEMDFSGMRQLLKEQREKRIKNEIKDDELTDLQTLLETFISLSDKDSLPIDEYPVKQGTRIELTGLDAVLDDLLNNFKDLSQYLREVVPLHFNQDKFKWAKLIEDRITKSCNENNAHFEMVNLNLQVGSFTEALFRPYKDECFSNDEAQEPKFKEIKKDKKLIGIAWGCLNSARKRVENKDLRGFLLKKQGFSIGKRENLARFFGSSNTHFDRYVGEIIVIAPDLLPNAARNGLEFSSLKTWFETQIAEDVAPYFNKLSNEFQESSKVQELITDYGNKLKLALTKFNDNEDNADGLINSIANLSEIKRNLKNKKNKANESNKVKLDNLLVEADNLEKLIKLRLSDLTKSQPKKPQKKKSVITKVQIAKGLTEYKAEEVPIKFENLLDLLDFLELECSEEIDELLNIIDEKFIQAQATTKADYYRLLNDLKNEFYNEEIA